MTTQPIANGLCCWKFGEKHGFFKWPIFATNTRDFVLLANQTLLNSPQVLTIKPEQNLYIFL